MAAEMFNVAGALSLLALLYFTIGIALPALPFVRTRTRAAKAAGGTMVVLIILTVAYNAGISPEEKQRLQQESAERSQLAEQDGAEAKKRREQGRVEREKRQEQERTAERQREDARWAASMVNARVLLADYSDNELAADNQYKGRRIQVKGVVRDVGRNIRNDAYVTVGTGRDFETPVVQCFFAAGQEERAATLRKGQALTVRGTVNGLSMNVLLTGCELVEI